jgi:hypothetical protein
MGASPGRLATRYDPDGRARLEQLTSEGSGGRQKRAPREAHYV